MAKINLEINFQSIRNRTRDYRPSLIEVGENRLASVALILRNLHSVPEVLFIERAKNENDPWSGQIAFPGGTKDQSDENTIDTAIRETREEVNLVLSQKSLMGRVDDQQGKNNFREIALIISCFVFHLESNQAVIYSDEVGDSVWIRLIDLLDEKKYFQYQTNYSSNPYPAIQLTSGKVLWGLTYRFVKSFLAVLE